MAAHCNVHRMKGQYVEEIFLDRLEKIKAQKTVLFGGEPLLYYDTFAKIVKTGKINSVSTNLLLLNKDNLKLINDYKLDVATSWNFRRFTPYQETLWLNNLALVKCTVLITLTDDLISEEGTSKLKEVLKKLDTIGTVDYLLFEQEVNNNLDSCHFERVDDWLCAISKDWTYSFENAIVDRLKDWKCDCSNVMTLEPNGTLRKGCPDYTATHFVNDCYKCSLNEICQPCVLQKECSFPKKLYQQVVNNE